MGATAVDVVSMPWAMTQNEPLDVEAFIREARNRGFALRTATLRELYRHRLLLPFVQITSRPIRDPAKARKHSKDAALVAIDDLAVNRVRLAVQPEGKAGEPGRLGRHLRLDDAGIEIAFG